ncbi:MAG: FAD-binding protein [Sphingosinicella sp.]|uniref:FAD-binding protein n=1 Tax=Sphingosinicella sp. TaxID=1917971 RepID=UPI004037D7AB
MARQPSFNPIKEWRNFHQSYEQVIEGEYDLFMPQQSAPLSFDDLKETTRQFQALIADARQMGLKIRAVGSSWSLSRAPATTGWALNTNRLRGRMKIAPGDIDPGYPGTADQKAGLYFFQCGNTVADVNKVIESKGQRRSLFTSGAANGQTIVGATACGTHGSALDFGALHDHIVAIHLIATDDSHFWIERQSRPVMSPAWVAKLGATLKRADDDLFNAAVVSFGSFGIIEAVVIETVPRYLLDTQPGMAPLDENLWKAIGALDFSAHPFFKRGKPYFFQAVINPATDEVLLNANYKRDKDDDREPKYGLTQDPKAIGPGFDALSTVGLILDAFKGLIPAFSQLAAKQLFDTAEKTGTPGEIYGYKAPLLHVASGSVAVALPDARRALETLIQLYKEVGPVPLVLGCRYVRKSPALLAFNKFDIGLMISIDGVDNKSARAYFAAAADRLEAEGIDYTQHWGKVNAYTRKRIDKAYGANVAKWLDARRQVLPDPADRALFDNAYVEERGLAG